MQDASQPAGTAKPRRTADPSLSGDDVRVAAAVHHELGAEYSDAVLASFLEKVEHEVAAQIEARLAQLRYPPTVTARAEPWHPHSAVRRRRAVFGGMAIGLAVSGVPLSLLYLNAVDRLAWWHSSVGPETGAILILVAVVLAVLVCAAVAGGLRPQLPFRRHAVAQAKRDRMPYPGPSADAPASPAG